MSNRKRKRPDVSVRKEANKNIDFTSIKSSWNSFCKIKLLADTIVEDILPKVNLICFLSYKLINFHFLRLLEEDQEQPLPEINQTLFYQCCCLVSVMKYRKVKTGVKNPELVTSFKQMEKYIKEEDLPARDYLGAGYISNLNALQVVNTKNHLKLNFYNRFKKYLTLQPGGSENAVVNRWLKAIYDPEYKDIYVTQSLIYLLNAHHLHVCEADN